MSGPIVDTLVPADLGASVIDALVAIGDPSIELFLGECSQQAIITLASGATIRIGVTDDDVGSGFLWIDGKSDWTVKPRIKP